MKQPFWKKALSYLFEFHIESTSSDFNPHLYVSLNRGRYQLCTANAVYSFGDLYDNFSDAFKAIELDKLPIKKVLILGFGLGSIPIMLEQLFHKKYEYTAVEIDEEVLYLANKYAMPEITSKIEFVCADAFLYTMQCQQKFDMILIDVFLDDIIPWEFEQIEFLKSIEQCLNPNGILLYNRLAHTKKDVENATEFYKDHFKPFFKNATYLEVKGNWILLNRNDVLKK